MPRTLSDAIKNVLAQNYGETHDLVILTLPASGELPEIVLYCGSVYGLVVDGQTYQPVLRGISQIKFSVGANADQATIQLENVSQTLGQTISDTTRTLDGSRVEIKRAYRVASGSFESISIFHGVVQGLTVDENYVTLTVVSDFTSRNAVVAGRQCTQRCIWAFKSPECGWRQAEAGNPPDQVGDPDDCNLIFDSDGGCKGHANQHRFGGVPPLIANQSTNPTLGVDGGPIGGGSTGGGNGTGDTGGYIDYTLRRKLYDVDMVTGALFDTELS